MYNVSIMNRFTNPQFAGSISKPDLVGKAEDEENGVTIKFYVRMNFDDAKIADVTFKTLGCPVTIACSDAICEIMQGKQIDELANITYIDIERLIGKIPVEKQYCLKTIENAITEIIKMYYKKFN